ncbi:secondary thiamine-phosphate synthase enzyme [bacterium F11]|nr:secondary thiamine-phosphate synthase enzyme [bacterium F11]
MQIKTEMLAIQTKGPGDIIDLTPKLKHILNKFGLTEGSVTVFNIGSTAGITTIEFEPGLIKDMNKIYEKIAPQKDTYHHHDTWGDYNGFSHCRASLQGPSLVIPYNNKELLLGTWQQVVLMEFDDRPRSRKVIAQFMGY